MFRRTFTGGGGGGVWALLLGSITALLQFFMGYMIKPGGFGLSRWLFGFFEIVSLPVLIPIILYAFLYLFRGLSGSADFADFALLWMIPVAALRAIGWGPTNDVILLISVPLLWTALAVGIPFFINLIANNFRWYTLILSIICLLILPLPAATSYWAFFSQQTALGFLLFFVTQIPLGLSFVFER
ncbi:hypothetical protein [Treponema sp. R6D11]